MKNCLKTQLKENVNNDNLPILGQLRLKDFYLGSGSGRHLQFSGVSGVTKVYPLKGHMYADLELTIPITERTCSGTWGTCDIYFDINEEPEFIIDKYTVKQPCILTSNDARPTIDFSDLYYCINLMELDLRIMKTSGKIEKLIESIASDWLNTELKITASVADHHTVTFNGVKITSNKYFVKENNLINVYSTKTDNEYSGLLGSYNINTNTWTYNS